MPVKLIECPRDAMQGIHGFIPTETKVQYLNKLLKVGFDTLDFGSFVSPKAIPQLKDTHEVVKQLDLASTNTRLLSIVANERGAKEASAYEQISYLGFPFSISQRFQMRNTNSTIEQSLERVKRIHELAASSDKQLVTYLSMGFGNPYGEEWNHEIVIKWVNELVKIGIGIIALSDTIGVSNRENISYLFSNLIPEFPQVEFGAHLHTTPSTWKEKVEAAYQSGCKRFDGALKGYGGCPMADNDLVGNMPMENMVMYFEEQKDLKGLDHTALAEAMSFTKHVFPES